MKYTTIVVEHDDSMAGVVAERFLFGESFEICHVCKVSKGDSIARELELEDKIERLNKELSDLHE